MRKLDRARKSGLGSAKIKADGEHAGIDQEAITKDMICEPAFRKYCIALSVWVQFLGAVHELVVIARDVVGDTASRDENHEPERSTV